jgi:hypothetical protein
MTMTMAMVMALFLFLSMTFLLQTDGDILFHRIEWLSEGERSWDGERLCSKLEASLQLLYGV